VDEQVRKETLQNWSLTVCHLDEPDQQLHAVLSKCNGILSKYSKEELLGILEFAVPPHWRKAFDLRDSLPTSDDKARFISECERVERNKAPPAKERDGSEDDRTRNKKTKFAKSEKSATKSGKKTSTESGPMYCTHCKTDTHVTEHCWKLKEIAREKERSEKKHHIQNGLSARKSMLLRTGRARTAISKLLRKLSSASRASTEKKKRNTQKWPVQKRLSLATQTPPMNPLMLWSQSKDSSQEEICAAYYPI
jgi:hypothetical protein